MNIKELSSDIEAISNSYAARYGIERSADWYMLKLQEELGELIQSYLMMTGQARNKDKSASQLQEGFESEIADVLCHALLLAKYHNVDIEQKITEKWLKYSQGQS